jgi:site-specific DNA-methyltransferase (adenine-specific)
MLELNELYNMDCMDGMREFPDGYFDLAITDPPYFAEANLHYHNGSRFSTHGVARKDYHKSTCWQVPTADYYNELCRVSKNQIIWGINYFDFPNVPVGRIVWDKQRAGLIGSFSDGEIASCSIGKAVRIFRFTWDGMLQGDMKNKEKKFHITQKPLALYRWILRHYANDGDKILDTHAGSASCLVACHGAGYDYVGFEIDKEYHRLAQERLSAVKAQMDLFLRGVRGPLLSYNEFVEQQKLEGLIENESA